MAPSERQQLSPPRQYKSKSACPMREDVVGDFIRRRRRSTMNLISEAIGRRARAFTAGRAGRAGWDVVFCDWREATGTEVWRCNVRCAMCDEACPLGWDFAGLGLVGNLARVLKGTSIHRCGGGPCGAFQASCHTGTTASPTNLTNTLITTYHLHNTYSTLYVCIIEVLNIPKVAAYSLVQ